VGDAAAARYWVAHMTSPASASRSAPTVSRCPNPPSRPVGRVGAPTTFSAPRDSRKARHDGLVPSGLARRTLFSDPRKMVFGNRPAIADLYGAPMTRGRNGQVPGLFPECAGAESEGVQIQRAASGFLPFYPLADGASLPAFAPLPVYQAAWAPLASRQGHLLCLTVLQTLRFRVAA